MNIFTWTPLEIAANVMTAICIFLAGRNSIHTWWTGIVSALLYGVMFFNVQLYADATLQGFFIVTGVLGWMAWKTRSNAVLPVSNVNPKQGALYISAALIVGAIYASILHKYTDAYAPWIDSTVLVLSVVAQILLMRKQIETWMVWFVVNTLCVPLFWSRELYLTSIMYGFFWVNAIVSYIHWKNIQKEQPV